MLLLIEKTGRQLTDRTSEGVEMESGTDRYREKGGEREGEMGKCPEDEWTADGQV